MPRRFTVAKVADLPPGEVVAMECGKERIAVFNVDGAYYAINDVCPHAGGRLSGGYLSAGQLMCPWHGWRFHLDPEKARENDGLLRYAVTVEDGAIHVELD